MSTYGHFLSIFGIFESWSSLDIWRHSVRFGDQARCTWISDLRRMIFGNNHRVEFCFVRLRLRGTTFGRSFWDLSLLHHHLWGYETYDLPNNFRFVVLGLRVSQFSLFEQYTIFLGRVFYTFRFQPSLCLFFSRLEICENEQILFCVTL